jgi:hypothetical protein
MTLEVIEVIKRTEQGHTRPFVCRCTDDQIYYVKGFDAGRRSLICEWLAGRLAQILELPVAPFCKVHIPSELVVARGHVDIRDLGAGLAFASLGRFLTELTLASAETVPDSLQNDVLVFDRWIRNQDRTLSVHGGNPNLFIEPPYNELVMIDHNLAFDVDFDLPEFLLNHAFRARAATLGSDFAMRDHYNARLFSALAHWQHLLAEIPQEWWYLDPEQTVPTDFDPALALKWLSAFQSDEFWQWR